jgi:ATP-binding cassette, subfamily G (WHITE), member 2, SNQ2
MINEFKHVNLYCNSPYLIPYGPSYSDVSTGNQVCTLEGSQPGQAYVRGTDYIGQSFEMYPNQLWRNLGIIIAFFVFFQAVQMYLVEHTSQGTHASSITVFKPEDADTKRRNALLQERKEAFRKGTAEQNLEGLIKTRKPFTWENLCYTVPVSGGKRQLLDNVFGYVKPGELTALMGASGAGKTTLLDVLANRKTIGVISGDVLVAGRPIDIGFQRGTAYVEQQDVHEWTTTVREALRFSAYLRQPIEVPQLEKDDYVEEIIQLLEMEDIADAVIGFPGYGLGVEARKRLTIGVELAAKPQLLLFLDEPTSGLDGQSAYNIVRFLRKLAAAGQAILCTIHQPNALLFEQFDRLLLLERGGRTVYFGPIGKDSHHLTEYLHEYGADCPPSANPAEYMLDAIGAGSQRRVGDRDWADIYLDSPLFEQNKAEIQRLKEQSLAEFKEDKTVSTEYATPFMYQLRIVVKRTFLSFWRMPDYGFTR